MNGFWLRGSPVRPLGCENRSRTLIPKIDNYVFNPSFFLCVDDCSQWPLYLLFHSVSLLGFFWGGFIGLETGFGWDWLGLCFFFRFLVFFFRSTLWMTSSWRSLTKPWKSRVPRKRTPSFFLRLEVLRTKKKLKKTNGNRLYGKPTPPHEVPYLHFFKKNCDFIWLFRPTESEVRPSRVTWPCPLKPVNVRSSQWKPNKTQYNPVKPYETQ